MGILNSKKSHQTESLEKNTNFKANAKLSWKIRYKNYF